MTVLKILQRPVLTTTAKTTIQEQIWYSEMQLVGKKMFKICLDLTPFLQQALIFHCRFR